MKGAFCEGAFQFVVCFSSLAAVKTDGKMVVAQGPLGASLYFYFPRLFVQCSSTCMFIGCVHPNDADAEGQASFLKKNTCVFLGCLLVCI